MLEKLTKPFATKSAVKARDKDEVGEIFPKPTVVNVTVIKKTASVIVQLSTQLVYMMIPKQ